MSPKQTRAVLENLLYADIFFMASQLLLFSHSDLGTVSLLDPQQQQPIIKRNKHKDILISQGAVVQVL